MELWSLASSFNPARRAHTHHRESFIIAEISCPSPFHQRAQNLIKSDLPDQVPRAQEKETKDIHSPDLGDSPLRRPKKKDQCDLDQGEWVSEWVRDAMKKVKLLRRVIKAWHKPARCQFKFIKEFFSVEQQKFVRPPFQAPYPRAKFANLSITFHISFRGEPAS